MQNADKLTKLASYGKYGGYFLGGLGVAASCVEIANTSDQQKKNEIFVETVASTTVGLVGGWAVGLFLVSNPRSEEHTSELQSRPHLVCRLLLEKKKNKNYNIWY